MEVETTDHLHYPMGTILFQCAAFGISSDSEKFQKNMTQNLQRLEGVECNIIDVLVHGGNQEEHDERCSSSSSNFI